uniref:Uncharacterized protein n=1 Tax=Anguilla anguilla TaxID=7936 RepID=A0A0E9UGB5_ANGAN
MITTADPFWVP